MATWDLIFPYDEVFAELPCESGCLNAPSVQPGNRNPTASEVRRAVEALGIIATSTTALTVDCDDPGFAWNDDNAVPERGSKMRGDLLLG